MFNVQAAKQAGYTDQEIEDYLKSTGEQPTQSDGGIWNTVKNAATSIAQPFINSGENILAVPQEVARLAASMVPVSTPGIGKVANDFATADNPFLSEDKMNQLDEDPSGAILQQAKDSANVLSYAVPFGSGGNVVSKAIAPGVLSGALQGASEEDASPTSIALAALAGGATGGVLHGAGAITKAAGNQIQKGAKFIQKGEDLGNANPNILNNVVEKDLNILPNSEKLKKTADEYGLFNDTVDVGLQKFPYIMKNLNEEIKDVLQNSKVPVDLNEAKKKFIEAFDKTTSFTKGSSDYQQALQEGLQKIDAIGGQTPVTILDAKGVAMPRSTPASAIDVYTLKQSVGDDLNRTFTKLVKGNPLTAKEESNLAMWSSLKDTLNTTVKEIAPLNNKQHDLIEIGKAFAKEYVRTNKAGSDIGLPEFFAAVAGNAAGGPLGAGAAFLLKSQASKPGVQKSIGAALDSVGNSVNSLGEGIKKAGTGIQSGVNEKTSSLIAGRIPGIIGSSGVHNTDNNAYNTGDNQTTNELQHNDGSIASAQTAVNQELGQTTSNPRQQYVTGYSPEQLGSAYTKALAANDNAAATTLKKLYDTETAYQKEHTDKDKNKTEKQQLFESAAQGAQHALSLLESGEANSGPVSGRVAQSGASTGLISSGQQDFMSTIAIARSALLNAYLGGNIPPQEYERISDSIPSVTDPKNVATQKLRTFIRETKRFANSDVSMPLESLNIQAAQQALNQ